MNHLSLKLNSFPSKKAKPFLKWAGGKSQLLNQFKEFYPPELKSGKIKKYFEPFLGGGAVFLNIAQKYKIEEAYLTDINQELVISYNVIKKNPDLLLEFLDSYSKHYYQLSMDKRNTYFYEIRDHYNLSRFDINYDRFSENWIRRTAQMIFLNKTCFNGLFRVNKSGGFNVPFGKYKNPKIFDIENIYSLSNVLQIAKISHGEFYSTEKIIDENSFVYFDPPYRPISKTASFTSYAKNGFNDENQIQLGKYFSKLNKCKNAKLMLSNSDPTNENPDDHFFDELYKNFHQNKVYANRMINCNGNNRGRITELLITNFKIKE
ncbi:MAG: Dam family site-specific DNA-(adenine-N6)-methyltransferase [Candidatus Marinimicrobia bacterium]|nr:Dam family site-specific DNA-(adenine-N6)-methyltransferase [Candidatus Neomarinimicrobiota bacterium]